MMRQGFSARRYYRPLVDGFYTCMHTVAPIHSATNLAFVQVPPLASYLRVSPSAHAIRKKYGHEVETYDDVGVLAALLSSGLAEEVGHA